MDRNATALAQETALRRFASSLRREIGAERVLLFGSRARGDAREDSDYDLILVSPRFAGIEGPRRGMGLRQLWYEAGGEGPMDLLCVTPAELAAAQRRISLIATVLPEAVELLTDDVTPTASR